MKANINSYRKLYYRAEGDMGICGFKPPDKVNDLRIFFGTKTWIKPQVCLPPHRVARPEQVISLYNEFKQDGWNPEAPCLVGYSGGRTAKKVQLLSGSHRWAAAMEAELRFIPVILYPYKKVEEIWGTDEWAKLMDALPAGSLFDRSSDKIFGSRNG